MDTPKDTRSHILSAALELFSEQGFAATGMRAIAARVGIKAPSIYNHFASKEAILAELLQHYGPGRMTQVLQHTENWEQPEALFDALLDALFKLWHDKTDNQLMSLVMAEALRNPSIAKLLNDSLFQQERQALAAFFRRAQQLGVVKPIDPELLADECLSRGIARRYEVLLNQDEPEAVARIAQQLRAQFEFFWEQIVLPTPPTH